MHLILLIMRSVLLLTFCLISYLKIYGCQSNRDICTTLSFKTRSQWGGLPSRHLSYRLIPIKYVIIHHTVSNECSTFEICSEYVQNIQDFHMTSNNFDDIGYNFLIGNDGNIYEGTGWRVIGAHTYGYNTNGTGIAFIGDFTNKLPSSIAINSAKQLLKCGVQMGFLDKNYELYGGKQLISTKSPGRVLYNEIQQWDHWSTTP